jgi:hypothetical protein
VSMKKNETPIWLAGRWDSQRARSAKMVEDALVALLTVRAKVTEEAVVNQTKLLDPAGKGISRSTLHRNAACRRRFDLARGGKIKATKASAMRAFFKSCDEEVDDAAKQRARRLMRLRKDELVVRLLTAEGRIVELEAAGYAEAEGEFHDVIAAAKRQRAPRHTDN